MICCPSPSSDKPESVSRLLQSRSCSYCPSVGCLLSVCLSVSSSTEAGDNMRLLPAVVTASLTLAVAYYVYIPLPDTIQEPWKLMMLDAVFRTTMHLVREEMFYLFINYYYYYLRIHYGACAAMEQVCNSSCDCDDNCVADISKYIIIIMMIIKRCSCMYDQLLK